MNSASPTLIGTVQDVNGTSVSVALTGAQLSGLTFVDGQGYRIGQIGSFVRIPVGYADLFGIVSQVGASAIPETLADTGGAGYRWLKVQLIGEGSAGGQFRRGISQYPTIDDDVHLVSQRDLERIYGRRGKQHHLVKVGHIAGSQSIDALVDINKLVTRHSAVVGTTGSGKSTTVASVVRCLSSAKNYPSSRILILDIHGEYQAAFADRAHVYKVNIDASKADQERLCLPFWAMEFDELMSLTFGSFPVDSKARNLIMERIIAAKVATVEADDDSDIDPEAVNADSPIPFDIKKLWYDLYCQEFGTYFSGKGKTPVEENWAYKLDAQGQPIKGDASKGLPPRFREVKSVAGDDEKINYLPETLNIRAQLEAFGAKLRIPRYNFFLRPGVWDPDPEGKTEETLACLIKGWIGSDRPVTILDLSGVPSAITNDVIGILLRLIYDCLFWARHLSQGGRERPLLLVLEEAHTYLNGDIGGRASTVVQRIVKEGRKYGIGAMIVSQRPSEINSTILSQCGTFFALRLSNGNDRSKITGAISENLEGLTSMLPILRTGEAIILGEGVGIPMRTMIEPPPKDKRPDSADPVVCDELSPEDSMIPGGWGIPMEADPNYEEVVALWRQQTPFTSALVNLDEAQG